MALQAVVGSLDDVPESVREFYEQSGDEYRLNIEGLDDGAALKDALRKEREARRKAERSAKKYDGLDPDEIAAMRERLAQIEEEQATGKGDWEKAKSQIEGRYTKELEKREQRIGSLEQRLEKVLKTDAALQAVTAADGIPDALLHHVVDHVDLVEEDGEFRTVARGLDGAEVESIEALVKQMKDSGKYDWGFRPNGATGGGATGRRAGGATGAITSRAKLSVADKAAYIREHGHEAYLQLPD